MVFEFQIRKGNSFGATNISMHEWGAPRRRLRQAVLRWFCRAPGLESVAGSGTATHRRADGSPEGFYCVARLHPVDGSATPLYPRLYPFLFMLET